MISSWYWSTNIKSYEYILNIKIKFKYMHFLFIKNITWI